MKAKFTHRLEYKSSDGTDESLRLNSVVGFTETWPNKVEPQNMRSAIVVIHDGSMIHFSSSEPRADLERRFDEALDANTLAHRDMERFPWSGMERKEAD